MVESHPFGARIRRKRLALLTKDPHYSLRRLAARLGIQASHLSRLERGGAPSLSEPHIVALAAELGENPDALLALAGKIPSDIRAALLAQPEVFAGRIRNLAGQPAAQTTATPAASPLPSLEEIQRLARLGSFNYDILGGRGFWSEEIFRMFRLPPSVPSPSFDAFVSFAHPEDQPVVQRLRQKLLAGKGPLRCSYRFRRSDGNWRYARLMARGESDASGQLIRITGTIQDVTTEQQALENMRSLAHFPEDNPNPVLRINPKGVLIYANAACTDLLDGLNLAVGKPVRGALAAAAAKTRQTGQRQRLEIALPRQSLELCFSPLPGDGGCNAYGRDITAEKEARQAAAVAETRFQRIFDGALLGIFHSAASGRILAVNAAMAKLFGYASPGEMIAAMAGDGAQAYADPRRREEIVRRLALDGSLRDFENPYRRKDGSVFIGSLHARLTTDDDGTPVVEGFVEDITERKAMEETIALSEERLKTHLRNFPLPTLTFCLRDRDLVLSEANKAAEILFRGRIGTCLEAPAGAIFDETPDIYLALWNTLEARRTAKRRLPFRPPGATEPGLFDMTFVFAAPDTVMLHAEEVTPLTRTRELLRRTNEQLRGILDHVPCAIYFKDLSGRCIMVNRALEKLFGQPASAIVGQPPGTVHAPEVAARLREDDRRILAAKQTDTYEEEIIAQGRTRRFLTTKVPLLDDTGTPYALCGMSLDITDVRELERTVTIERDTLRTVLAYVPYAACLIANQGQLAFLNKRFVDLTGYTLEDVPDTATWMRKAYPSPKLRRQVAADWQKSRELPLRRVYPVRCGDGSIRNIDFRTMPLPDGKILLTMAAVEDAPGRRDNGNGPAVA